MINLIGPGLLIGIGGTIAMDIWALLQNRIAGISPPNWGMVGRWVGHLPGRVVHDDISVADAVRNERLLGWAFHYAVGAIYGVIFLWIVGAEWLSAPSFGPIWVFGIVTVGAGWFVLQPGLGLGVAAAKADNPWKVRGLNLVAHTVFALGAFATALVLP